MASFTETSAQSTGVVGSTLGSPMTGNIPVPLVRKCLGKNKQNDCIQNMDHTNTRWECSYETTSKEDFSKHCKNIAKRVKWRDLIENAKTDKEGYFRCVYYSTDRHHVENHYTKGSSDVALSPSPQQVMRYKNYLSQRGAYNYATPKRAKRENEDGDDEDNISPEDTAREMKKLKQDASLLGFFQDQHMDPSAEGREVVALPDSMKTAELIEAIEKKLEIGHDICQGALEKLHKQGFMIVSGLKTLKKEGWEKLELPLGIEEEIKTQIAQSRSFAPSWYGMGVPFAWGFPHQGGFWSGQYNNLGQPVYMPYPPYESQDSVLGMGEVGSENKDKEKDKEGENGEVQVPTIESTTSETAPAVPLVPADQKPTSTNEEVKTEVKTE